MRAWLLIAIALPWAALSAAQEAEDVALHARAGAAALAARNWETAEREYKEALRLDPGVAELASNAGLALYYQRKFNQAAEMFERALHTQPELLVPLLFLGQIRIEQGREAEAVSYLERSVRLQPNHSLARRLLARALVSVGAHEQAFEQLRQATTLDATDPELFYSLSKVSMHLARTCMEGAAHERARYYETIANQSSQRMVELQPESHRVHQLAAEVAIEQGRTGDAIGYYGMALARKPQDTGLVLGLGQAYRKDGQLEAALAQFQKLLDRDANDAAANLSIAQCHLALKDSQRAYDHARRAAAAHPAMLGAHAVMGRALAMQERTAEATVELEKAAPSDRDGSLHYQIFLAYKKLQQPAKAQAALRKSKELRSKVKDVQ